ncbi:MAG: DinB family protein [Ginsengibacter sp.]
MKESIDIMRGGRKFLINLLDGISIEKLNEIPEGFHNNLAWNVAHMIANQQILCYRNAGAKPVIQDEFIDKYKTGTQPENFIDENEFENFLKHLISTIDQLKKDSETKMFKHYEACEFKSYPGLRLKNVKDAAKFVNFHDGLHIGYCMALKRALKK